MYLIVRNVGMKFLIMTLLCTLMPQLANSVTITFADGERLMFGK